MLTEARGKSKVEITTGHKTLKAARADGRYISTFLTHGNAKLKDYIPAVHGRRNTDEIALIPNDTRCYKYAQHNLPAVTTCPFATSGCKKFCYAKRDERWPDVKRNRNGNLVASRDSIFTTNMVYTINTELVSRRYAGSVMVLRIHESGEFYNQTYLNDWLDVIGNFVGRNDIIFQFYTKAFDYILSLDNEHSSILRDGLNCHNIGMSLSIDDTTEQAELEKAIRIKAMYPSVNIYYATTKENIEKKNPGHICKCGHCARCGHCTTTTGELVAVEIH